MLESWRGKDRGGLRQGTGSAELGVVAVLALWEGDGRTTVHSWIMAAQAQAVFSDPPLETALVEPQA